jgi:hypothetical protein
MSLRSCIHFVGLGARQARDEPASDRVLHLREHHRNGFRRPLEDCGSDDALSHDHVRLQGDEFVRIAPDAVGIAPAEAEVDLQVLPLCPSGLLQALLKGGDPSGGLRLGDNEERAEVSYLGRLSVPCVWADSRRTTE